MCLFQKITLILLVSVFIVQSYEQRDEGDACSQLGYPGTCQRVKNCEIALDALKNKGRHDLKRCGFTGKQEIVCCPDLSVRNPTIEATTQEGVVWPDGETPKPNKGDNVGNNIGRVNLKRKCEKMCEKIYTDNNIKPDIDFHILNGENAAVGQFPHMVALGFLNADDEIEWNCGASLISQNFLLTAAHCFVCNGCSDPVKARLGIVDITVAQSAQDLDVKNATPHPDYNPISKHNDIGIIELVQNVQMTKIIYPACLYTEVDDPLGLQIIGWGQTVSNEAKSKAKILQYAVIESVPINQCNITVTSKNQFSSKVILHTQICATTRSDACAGDSGGPLQIKKKEGGYAIVGVVSYGVQCGTPVPGIYTRVARYLDWIEQMVWPD